MREYSGRMSAQSMREIIFDDHADSRTAFSAVFEAELTSIVDSLAATYGEFQSICQRFPEGDRSAVVFSYLHLALNSLIGGTSLLMAGYMAPAGNLMRQFAEATAMATLCAEKTNNTFSKYMEDGFRYPFHKVLDRVSSKKIQRLLEIDPDAWSTFKDIASFYDQHSHASDMAIAANIIFDRPGVVVLGGQFDPGKIPHYRTELNRILSASDVLRSLFPTTERCLSANEAAT